MMLDHGSDEIEKNNIGFQQMKKSAATYGGSYTRANT